MTINASNDHHVMGIIDNMALRLKNILKKTFLFTKSTNWINIIDNINRLKEISGFKVKPFGDYNLCLIGDFFQLEAVGSRLYNSSLHLYQLTNVDSPRFIGGSLFTKFIKLDLTEPMRSSEDLLLQRLIKQIRNLDIIYPIDDEFIDILYNQCQLKKEDIESDSLLRDATICIISNIEKAAYEMVILKKYAIDNGYPIIKWKTDIITKLPDECIDLLFSDYHKNFHFIPNFCPWMSLYMY